MSNVKKVQREKFRSIRNEISLKRRKEAKRAVFIFLKKISSYYKNIVSFANKKEEIDLWNFNLFLFQEKRLFLPKIIKEKIQIFQVLDIKNLELNKKFFILEPDDKRDKKIDISIIDLILVPGLAFDKKNARLGFGKGFYDKLLFQTEAKKIGICFKEQLSKELLFQTTFDIKMNEVHSF